MVNSRRGGRSTAAKTAVQGFGKGEMPERKKGEKGAGKGEGKKGAVKGSGKGEGKKGSGKSMVQMPPQDRYVAGAKTVQELEAEMLLAKGGTTKERREAVKQPLEAKGHYCEVKKHSDMGCAVVTFSDQAIRDEVMRLVEEKPENQTGSDKRPSIKVSGVDVQCRPHFDKAIQEEIKNDIFVAWGRQSEKTSALPVQLIAEAVDLLVVESRGGQLTPENGVLGSPAHSPSLAAQLGAPQQMLPTMQLPQSLTQMLQPPMVPGPQPQQQNAYVDFMKYAWAAQQQQAAQQQAAAVAAMQQQPPPSPSPSGANAGLLETPPRPGSLKMRAEAAVFTPPPVGQQQQFLDQSQYAYNELDQYADFNYMASLQQPKKQFAIVNPNSGQAIEMQQQIPGFEPKAARKPIKIVDPNSKQTIDTLGMIFTPPKAAKNFSIIDPTSGSKVQVA